MSYKIAIASSDRINIDGNFGAAHAFLVYEVAESGKFAFLEIREVPEEGKEHSACNDGCAGSGCCGFQGSHPKVDAIAVWNCK